jgi:uncharacterized protein YuzE
MPAVRTIDPPSHNGLMRITLDRGADAAYIYLTANERPPGRRTIQCPNPSGADTELSVLMDWKDGKIVGVEILNASKLLHEDLLAEAEVLA